MRARPEVATVLVVGEDTAAVDPVVDALSPIVDDVTVVDGAREATAELAGGSPTPDCLVVVDSADEAEFDSLARIRQAVPDRPVLVVTDASRTAAAFDAGATDVHPIAGDERALRSRVDRLLDRSGGRDRRRGADDPDRDGADPGGNRSADVPAASRLRGREQRLEAVHEFAHEVADCGTVDDVCWRAVDAAEEILSFDVCHVGLVEDGYVVPKAASNEEGLLAFDAVPRDEGAVGEALRTGEPVVHERRDAGAADPGGDGLAWEVTIPLGDVGVFQAVSGEREGSVDADAIDENRALAELLLSHVAAAVRRIRVETELREERDRLKALFENLPEPVAACHAEGEAPIVDDVNAAFERVFGYDRKTVVGEDIDEFVLPDGDEGVSLDETYYVGNTLQSEVRRRTDSGVRDFLVTVIPVELGDFSAEGFVVYTDISGQKRREAELRRQNDRLAEFTSLVSHDLRNPLNVAKGHLDLAAAADDDDTEVTEHLDTATHALDRMGGLIADFLSLARQGRTVDDPVPVDVGEAVRRAWRTVDTGDDATLSVDGDLPTVPGDPERLRTVFENLFRNAVEHAGPSVAVEVAPLPDGSGFYVADDGPGIPPDRRDSVFEYGFTTESDGTGFGLATVQRVVEAHGWSVAVEDRPDGASGCRFTVRLD